MYISVNIYQVQCCIVDNISIIDYFVIISDVNYQKNDNKQIKKSSYLAFCVLYLCLKNKQDD